VPSAGRPRAIFLKFEECHLPTLLVSTASPAGRAAPKKLAYQDPPTAVKDEKLVAAWTVPASALFRFFHLLGSRGFVQRADFTQKCTILHKTKNLHPCRDPA